MIDLPAFMSSVTILEQEQRVATAIGHRQEGRQRLWDMVRTFTTRVGTILV